MTRRRYTDEEKAEALACVRTYGGSYEQAARATGIPKRTLQDWMRGSGNTAPVPALPWRPFLAIADTLDEKVSQLVGAIDDEKIAKATLAQITSAISTLIDKAHALRHPATVTPEELEHRQAAIALIITRYVTDPDTLDKIATDISRLGTGDRGPGASAASEGAVFGPVDTDEGECD